MASAPAIEKGTPGMASGETEKAIADSEEEEDKTPPREIDISRLLYLLWSMYSSEKCLCPNLLKYLSFSLMLKFFFFFFLNRYCH